MDTLTFEDAQRLFARVAYCEASGCMLWQGALTHDGYGKIRIGGRVLYTHRAAWLVAYGNVPAYGSGIEFDHKCRVRNCLNVGHIRATTHRENMQNVTAGAPRRAKKVRCVRGHDLMDPSNTYVSRRGQRVCRACRNMHGRAWRARKKNRTND